MAKESFEAFGERKTFAQWLEDPRCVVTKKLLTNRVYAWGWSSFEKALSTPAQRVPRDSLEADRAKAPVRVHVPEPTPEPRQRRNPRVDGLLRMVPENHDGWRDQPAEDPTPIHGQDSSIRALRGGLPSLGKRR
ncbi:hypothetical protein ACFT38_28515 [Streptomyces sp. NPDC056975]|uniref:hypothetical protein n=1 Tax=Streptomyces sp. NPDC056975 TaxID=3345985 RepID=UPI003634149A